MKNQLQPTGTIFVVGGVTVDTIHLPGRDAPVISPGGAGLYTALGAVAARGQAVLFAQQPRPMPALLQPVKDRLDWQGPIIKQEGLPRLEIAHYGEGRAELVAAHWGAQLTLSIADLPADLSQFGIVHVAALGPTLASLAFVQTSRAFEDVLLGNTPAWILQSVLPIGFGLIAWRYALYTVRELFGLFHKEAEA